MKMTAVVAQAITERLGAAIGMDAGAMDAGRLQWIVRSRCRSLGLPDAVAYAAHLESDVDELDALVEEVVVQETRFFRDPAVFEHIRQLVPKLAEEVAGPLRILSAPCGTGQEAYSLAVTLQEAGVPPARFAIDAFDISHQALVTARDGVYPEQALRHLSAETRRCCGTHEGKHWTMHKALRERVNFERRNLAEAGALGDEAKYHLILCRNLFIYLRPEARRALAESLAGALLPGGRLVIGTADRVEELNAVFAPVRPAASFAFTHREHAVTAVARDVRVSAMREEAAVKRVARRVVKAPEKVVEQVSRTAADLYLQAVDHREHGNLRKAERRCRQALYLEPGHLAALELLETLWRQQPNVRMRRALVARIVRTRLAAQITDAAAWKETA